MRVLSGAVIAFHHAWCLWLIPASVAPSLAAAACATANPAADFAGEAKFGSDQEIQASYTAARAAEGCNTPLVLPAGFDAMTPQQQNLWLFNSEREVRGIAPLKFDGTLMSQIALNHSLEMAKYGYFNHPSPINQVGVGEPGVNLPPRCGQSGVREGILRRGHSGRFQHRGRGCVRLHVPGRRPGVGPPRGDPPGGLHLAGRRHHPERARQQVWELLRGRLRSPARDLHSASDR